MMHQLTLFPPLVHYIYPVPAEDFADTWPILAPFIARAVEQNNGEHTLNDVRLLIERGEMFLWAIFSEDGVFHGAAVTEFIFFPNEIHYNVSYLGGRNMKAWMEGLYKAFTQHARANGAAKLTACIHDGLVEKLESLGLRKKYYLFSRDLRLH